MIINNKKQSDINININNTDETRGLECTKCGCQHFWVIYTRPGIGGKLIRRRECRHCGKRITTYEQTAN